jgi:hypothetical protein
VGYEGRVLCGPGSSRRRSVDSVLFSPNIHERPTHEAIAPISSVFDLPVPLPFVSKTESPRNRATPTTVAAVVVLALASPFPLVSTPPLEAASVEAASAEASSH